MCGIFGWSMKSGRVPAHVRGILAATLSRLNDDRGGHSWGMCATTPTGPHIVRGMGEMAYNAHECAPYEQMYAHTRWATTGEKTYKNAHPFEIDHIVGAHNGMIYNHSHVNDKYNRSYDVDSMHIFAHIAQGRKLNDLDGYGAIEWVDRNESDRIYLTKLHGGEMSVWWLGSKEDPDGVIWSSEKDHVQEALMCAGITQAVECEIERNRVHYVVNGEVFNTGVKMKLHHTVKTTSPISLYKDAWSKLDDDKWELNLQELVGKDETDDLRRKDHYLTGVDEEDLSDWRAWNDYCMRKDDESDDEGDEGYGH